MAVIPLGTGDWELASADISRIKLRNMYLIQNPLSPDEISRVTRPSLDPFASVGSNGCKGFWRQAGSIKNRWLMVFGQKIYARDTTGTITEIDDLPGTGYADFAADKARAVVVRDGLAYFTDGVTLTAIAMPGSKLVESVAGINSYFILTVKDDDVFYWIEPAETTVDPLNFATAERSPDPIKAVRVIFDEVWFIGENGPEVWQTTGDSASPFQRINGRVYNEGCDNFATAAIVLKNSLPALIWVTPNRSVVLAQGQVGKISDVSVDELLEGASDLRGWAFRTKKSDFYALSTSDFTLVYDIQRGNWYSWDSYDLGYWRAHLGIQQGSEVYGGDALTGQIWRLGFEGFDNFETPIVKELTGLVLNAGEPMPCYSVGVRVNSGWPGSYEEPEPLELFLSDDLGVTWSTAIEAPMGADGEYLTDVQFRSLGNISRPGKLFRFRHSGKTKLRLDYATINEGLGT